MLVKFSCANDASYGLRGLLNAINTIVSTPANTVPSAPAGISTWSVIGNAEAGGWTVDGSNLVPDGVTLANTVNYIQISATTPKTSGSDYGQYKKTFRMNINSSNNGNTNCYEPVAYATFGGQNNYVSTFWSTAANGGVVSAATNAYTPFNNLNGTSTVPATGYYIIASTSSYFYIGYAPNGFSPGRQDPYTGNAVTPIFGIGDLTSGAPGDYSPSDPHFPCASFNSNNLQEGSANFPNSYGDTIGYRFFTYDFQFGTKAVDPTGNAYGTQYTSYWGGNPAGSGNANGTFGKTLLPLGPTYGAAGASNTYYYNYDMQYDSTNNLRPSLVDVTLFNPLQNFPLRKLLGIKYAGLFSYSDSYNYRSWLQQSWAEKLIYDEDGIPWFIVFHQGVPRALRAR